MNTRNNQVPDLFASQYRKALADAVGTSGQHQGAVGLEILLPGLHLFGLQPPMNLGGEQDKKTEQDQRNADPAVSFEGPKLQFQL